MCRLQGKRPTLLQPSLLLAGSEECVEVEGSESGDGHASAGNIPLAGLLKFFAWMIWAIMLIFLIGFHIAIPVFVFTFFKFFGRFTWARAAIATVIAAGFLYGLFEIILKVGLFRGILLGEQLPHW